MAKITQAELDDVYDTINILMKNSKWGLLTSLFECWEMMAWRTDLDILLGYATASLPGKSNIRSRAKFIETCKRLHPDPELWKGLD